ncbi:hypothetical protein Bbelb_111710 [Branchiostoma belcheri]|nr:hypothetical protein Bbelb_111710 [Branchiostoma belcheri]
MGSSTPRAGERKSHRSSTPRAGERLRDPSVDHCMRDAGLFPAEFNGRTSMTGLLRSTVCFIVTWVQRSVTCSGSHTCGPGTDAVRFIAPVRTASPFRVRPKPDPSGTQAMADTSDHEQLYSTLGVPSSATHADIVDAYKKEVKLLEEACKYGKKSTVYKKAETRLREVSKAFAILSDEPRRQLYDNSGTVNSTPKITKKSRSHSKGYSVNQNEQSTTIFIPPNQATSWIAICEEHYSTQATNRGKDGHHIKTVFYDAQSKEAVCSVSITVYVSTDKMLVQGSAYLLWFSEEFPRLKEKVSSSESINDVQLSGPESEVSGIAGDPATDDSTFCPTCEQSIMTDEACPSCNTVPKSLLDCNSNTMCSGEELPEGTPQNLVDKANQCTSPISTVDYTNVQDSVNKLESCIAESIADRKTAETSILKRLSVLEDRLKSCERSHVCVGLSAPEKRQLVEDVARLGKVKCELESEVKSLQQKFDELSSAVHKVQSNSARGKTNTIETQTTQEPSDRAEKLLHELVNVNVHNRFQVLETDNNETRGSSPVSNPGAKHREQAHKTGAKQPPIQDKTNPSPTVSPIILFHVGTNDTRDKRDPTAVSEGFRKLIQTSHTKYPQTTLVFSSILPREDRKLQEVVAEETDYVLVTDNSNLSDRGTLKEDLYRPDGYHLNSYGVRVLVSNIKRVINPFLYARPILQSPQGARAGPTTGFSQHLRQKQPPRPPRLEPSPALGQDHLPRAPVSSQRPLHPKTSPPSGNSQVKGQPQPGIQTPISSTSPSGSLTTSITSSAPSNDKRLTPNQPSEPCSSLPNQRLGPLNIPTTDSRDHRTSHRADSRDHRTSHRADSRDHRTSHRADSRDHRTSHRADSRDHRTSHRADSRDHRTSHRADSRDHRTSHRADSRGHRTSHRADSRAIELPTEPTAGTTELPTEPTAGTTELPTEPTAGAIELPTEPTAGATELPTEPTAGTTELPTEPTAGTTELPTEPTAGAIELPTEPTAGTTELPTEPTAGTTELPTEPTAGAIELPTEPTAGAIELPTEPTAGTTELPTEPTAGTTELPTEPTAGAIELPTEPTAGATELPTEPTAGAIELPTEPTAGATELPTEPTAGAIELPTEPTAGATELPTEPTAGATELPTEPTAGTTELPTEPTAGAIELPTEPTAGATELPTEPTAGTTELPTEPTAGTTELPTEPTAGAIELPTEPTAGTTELPTEPTAGTTELPTEPTAGAIELPTEPTAGATELPTEPTAGAIELPTEPTAGATELPTEPTAGAIELPTEPTAGATELPTEPTAGTTELPTEPTAGAIELPTESAAGATELPTESAAGTMGQPTVPVAGTLGQPTPYVQSPTCAVESPTPELHA